MKNIDEVLKGLLCDINFSMPAIFVYTGYECTASQVLNLPTKIFSLSAI